MEPIHVPAPPRQAFNKNRRISDLILAQIRHLKHLEEKLPAQLREQLPQHSIVTEDDAARYIAPMTRLLRGEGAAAGAPASVVSAAQSESRQRVAPSRGLSIAASAKKTKAKAGAAPRKGKKR